MITHSCLVCDFCVLYRMVFIPVFTSLLFVPLIQMYCNLHLFNLNFNLQALIFAYGIEGDGRALKSYLFAVDQIDHSACSMSLSIC